MKWTLDEKDLLKSKNYSLFSDREAVYDFSSHAGFDYYVLYKNDDGTVKYVASYPVNVDVDDGSYDTRVSTTTHDNLQAFFNRTK